MTDRLSKTNVFRTTLRSLVVAYWSVLTAGQNLGALQSSFSAAGVSAFFPSDAGYAGASQAFNERFTLFPVAVVFPKNIQQVSAAVKAAFAQNLQVAARSGGHSYIANGLGGKDGAVVVDLSNLKQITVNAKTGTASVETGNRLGDVALALNAKGRALPHGTCPYVGIGGHAAYGGFGFASRLWGLTLDNTVSADVVLANGTIAKASSTVNSDLFWALRGSAGSFGIVALLEFHTFAAPPSVTVFSYSWTFKVNAATDALLHFQTFVESGIPPELGAEIDVFKGSSPGTIDYELTGGYYGPATQFEASIAPYLAMLPTPTSSSVQPGSYIASVQNFAGGGAGGNLDTSSAPDTHDTFYVKSLMTPEDTPMSAAAIRAFFHVCGQPGFCHHHQLVCAV